MTDIYRRITIITRDGVAEKLPFSSSVMALGTFDGVHYAHRRLLIKARELKSKLSAQSVGVWCFQKSPASILNESEALTLTQNDEKIKLLLECGADFVVSAAFEDFRSMDAEAFAKDVLISCLHSVGTACGYNHRFGNGGLGDPAMLESIFGKENTVTVPQITLEGEAVSSTAIRQHVMRGEIEIANKMLSRPLSFIAPVLSGKRLGRKIGFPTANQTLPRGFSAIRHGVYATRCIFEDGQVYFGVSNIGVRPSIISGDDHRVNAETYIIGFSGELYGKVLTLELHSYLREEKIFSTLDELKSAIEQDKIKTISFFNSQND